MDQEHSATQLEATSQRPLKDSTGPSRETANYAKRVVLIAVCLLGAFLVVFAVASSFSKPQEPPHQEQDAASKVSTEGGKEPAKVPDEPVVEPAAQEERPGAAEDVKASESGQEQPEVLTVGDRRSRVLESLQANKFKILAAVLGAVVVAVAVLAALQYFHVIDLLHEPAKVEEVVQYRENTEAVQPWQNLQQRRLIAIFVGGFGLGLCIIGFMGLVIAAVHWFRENVKADRANLNPQEKETRIGTIKSYCIRHVLWSLPFLFAVVVPICMYLFYYQHTGILIPMIAFGGYVALCAAALSYALTSKDKLSGERWEDKAVNILFYIRRAKAIGPAKIWQVILSLLLVASAVFVAVLVAAPPGVIPFLGSDV